MDRPPGNALMMVAGGFLRGTLSSCGARVDLSLDLHEGSRLEPRGQLRPGDFSPHLENAAAFRFLQLEVGVFQSVRMAGKECPAKHGKVCDDSPDRTG